MKKYIVIILFIFLGTSLFTEGRGLFLNCELGATYLSYTSKNLKFYEDGPKVIDETLDIPYLSEAMAVAGLERQNSSFTMSLGYSFFGDMYFLAGLTAITESFSNENKYDNKYYHMTLQYPYIGFRHYPNQTGVFYEINAGYAPMTGGSMYTPNENDNVYNMKDNWIFDTKFGYDFDRNTNGLSFNIVNSLGIIYMTKEKYHLPFAGIFGGLTWK